MAIAAPLSAGAASHRLGSLLLHFGSRGAPATGYELLLLRCARAIGAGLRARREVQLARAAASVVKDIYPSHVVPQLLRHHSRQARFLRRPRAGCSRVCAVALRHRCALSESRSGGCTPAALGGGRAAPI